MGKSFSSGTRASTYNLFAKGVDTTKPVGLVLHMHGDGGWDFKNPDDMIEGVSKSAAKHDLITISMFTPDKKTVTWYEDGDANGKWIRALLEQQIYKQYNIDRNRVWLIGYSGGSTFMSNYFLRQQSSLFCGGAAMFFGGGGDFGRKSTPIAASFKKSFRMHFYTGLLDNGDEDGWSALKDSKEGAKYWKGLGFTVTEEHPAGIHHNNIPFGKVAEKQFNLYAGKRGAGIAPSATKAGITVTGAASTVTAKGQGYKAGESVTVTALAGTKRATRVVKADKAGAFTVKFGAPAGFAGTVTVTATGLSGKSSGSAKVAAKSAT